MSRLTSYLSSIGKAFGSLLTGMHRTMHSMVHPKLILTQQYPENRETLYIPPAFKGGLELVSDENGKLLCTACGICQMSCPNGTIRVGSRMAETAEGRPKKQLESYTYNLGSCTFCGLCVDACPFHAIVFNNRFERSEYLKDKLVLSLYKSAASNPKTEQ